MCVSPAIADRTSDHWTFTPAADPSGNVRLKAALADVPGFSLACLQEAAKKCTFALYGAANGSPESNTGPRAQIRSQLILQTRNVNELEYY
jgi:hypothetical protein